jgi:hypothetical protein
LPKQTVPQWHAQGDLNFVNVILQLTGGRTRLTFAGGNRLRPASDFTVEMGAF